MNTEQILSMAREAGAIPVNGAPKELALAGNVNLENFARLVALAERKACIKACEEIRTHSAGVIFPEHCVKAINARGKV